MKKAVLIALISVLLSGCSYTDVLSLLPTPLPPTATATATFYVSPTVTPSTEMKVMIEMKVCLRFARRYFLAM